MIVPMKKATILFETKDTEATIQYVRQLGVLHVEHQNLPEGRDISALQENFALINSSFDVLNQVMVSGKITQPQKKISDEWMTVAHHIIDLRKRQEQLEASSGNIIGQINKWERWGDVDLNQIQHLNQHGIYLKLYQVPVKDVGNFPDDVVVKTIFTTGDTAYCVVISRRQFECTFEEIPPPNESLSSLKSVMS